MLYHCAKKRGFWLVPVATPPRQTVVCRLEAPQNTLPCNYEIASRTHLIIQFELNYVVSLRQKAWFLVVPAAAALLFLMGIVYSMHLHM